VRAASATQQFCSPVVESGLATCHHQMAAYIAGSYTRVYTMAKNGTTGDNSHFTMTDVDTMPCILALITSCFSVFKIPYVTVKFQVTQHS
jgi:hypothetical protein